MKPLTKSSHRVAVKSERSQAASTSQQQSQHDVSRTPPNARNLVVSSRSSGRTGATSQPATTSALNLVASSLKPKIVIINPNGDATVVGAKTDNAKSFLLVASPTKSSSTPSSMTILKRTSERIGAIASTSASNSSTAASSQHGISNQVNSVGSSSSSASVAASASALQQSPSSNQVRATVQAGCSSPPSSAIANSSLGAGSQSHLMTIGVTHGNSSAGSASSEENVAPLSAIAVVVTDTDHHRNDGIAYQYVPDPQAANVDLYTQHGGNQIVVSPQLHQQQQHQQLQYGNIYAAGPAVQQQYYYDSGQVPLGGSQFSGGQAIVQGGALYVHHTGPPSQQNSPSDEESGHHLSHTTRASPATIQWLLQNYETAEGVSLPRCTLYNHYLRHCAEHKLDPVNAASFGKLIRSVFLGLRTRRLGTRGNSKYHYYGIRIKPDSPLNRVSEDQMASMQMARRQEPQSRGAKYSMAKMQTQQQLNQPSQQQQGASMIHGGAEASVIVSPGSAAPANNNNVIVEKPRPVYGSQGGGDGRESGPPAAAVSAHGHSQSSEEEDAFREYLGAGGVPDVAYPTKEQLQAQFESGDAMIGAVGLIEPEQCVAFCDAYRLHCQQVLEFVHRLKFAEVEATWKLFWQPVEIGDADEQQQLALQTHPTSGLLWMQFYALCAHPAIQEFVRVCDLQFYQNLVSVLIPNVLRPIPSRLLQNIRNFAKGSESSLANALIGVPEAVAKIKLSAISAFAQTLRRYTSLNHLAQAARGVLQNHQQVQQMLSDLNRVNFKDVQEQASWVCLCDASIVESIENDFKLTLEKQRSLEEWADWLMAVVDRVLLYSSEQQTVVSFIESARQFLLKWSFYSSMVIRDLTLRSAASFGSFHLIRLLYDEYMYYLVEHKIAQATGQTAIAVMSQSSRFLCPHLGDAMTTSSSIMLDASSGSGGMSCIAPAALSSSQGSFCSHVLSQSQQRQHHVVTSEVSFGVALDNFGANGTSNTQGVEAIYCNGSRAANDVTIASSTAANMNANNGRSNVAIDDCIEPEMEENEDEEVDEFLRSSEEESEDEEPMNDAKRPKLL